MNRKLFGALLIIISCGGCGFSVASAYKAEAKVYKNLISALALMKAELQYRLTSLPELCDWISGEVHGPICVIFSKFAQELQTWTCPDAASCMRKVISEDRKLPSSIKKLLTDLGNILGRFDLNGQIEGLDMIKEECISQLQSLNNHNEERLRGYQTLGLCAGAALVILFI